MAFREFKGESLISFPDDYVCVDIETTGLDFEYDEIIEVAAIRIANGIPGEVFSSLIRPKTPHAMLTYGVLKEMGYQSFTEISAENADLFFNDYLPKYITELTGITNEMLKNAPPMETVLPLFHAFVGDSILVGHNVNFDINFLYDGLFSTGRKLPNDFIDTMRIFRALCPELKHHRLQDMTSRFYVEQDNSHRASADAKAVAECFEAMKAAIRETGSYEDFIVTHFRDKNRHYNERLAAVAPTVEDFDETHPIFGKIVVFTGALSSMSRKEAFQIVANLGGFPEDTLTKKTNFLVVGNEEFTKSVKNGKTSKMIKAEGYRAKGADIVTLSENTFFDMIQ